MLFPGFFGGVIMNKKALGILIAIITFAVAVSASLTTFFIVNEKKKRDEEELERYLDCSIQ